jgi:hypothetical protein
MQASRPTDVYSGTVPETDGSEGIVGENLLAIPLSGGRPIPLTLRSGYHGASFGEWRLN